MMEAKKSSIPFHLATLGILAGGVLTLISWLKLCSVSCNDAHNYRLFHLPFELTGAVFFASLGALHFMGLKKTLARMLAGLLIAAGIGAEGYFIFLQKNQIGVWCPVCLSIAASLAFTGICYLFLIYKSKEDFMNKWLQTGLLTLCLTLGAGSSFLGISKIDQLQAVEDAIKEKIKFGNPNSEVQVFVFTDWACPACRMVEPQLEAMGPKISGEAQLTFVDTVVHPETLNYAPFNISFMVNNKAEYYKIREALGKLSTTKKKPTEQDIEKAIAPLGASYKEVPYADVTVAMRYFEELADKFKVKGTPTVAIVNIGNKKGKKLSGVEEITEANILKAIRSLK